MWERRKTRTVDEILDAAGGYEGLNRRHALGLGAAELVSRWEHLIAVLERVLAETFSGTAPGIRRGIDGT